MKKNNKFHLGYKELLMRGNLSDIIELYKEVYGKSPSEMEKIDFIKNINNYGTFWEEEYEEDWEENEDYW